MGGGGGRAAEQPCKPAVAASVRALHGGKGVKEVNLETKCKLAGSRPLALPRSWRARTPFSSLPKNARPKENENCTPLHSRSPGVSAARFSAALARSIFKVKMKNKDIRGDGREGGEREFCLTVRFPHPHPRKALPSRPRNAERGWGRLWYRFKFAELS